MGRSGNLWRIDPSTAKFTPFPLSTEFDRIVDDTPRGIWGIRTDLVTDRAVVAFVSLEGVPTVREKHVPSMCKRASDTSVVFRRRFWLNCGKTKLVFDRSRAGKVNQIARDGALLTTNDALWITSSSSAECIAGDCGRRAPVRMPSGFVALDWSSSMKNLWVLGYDERNGDMAIARVTTTSGQIRLESIQLYNRPFIPDTIRIVADEIWLIDTLRAKISRYGDLPRLAYKGRVRVPVDPRDASGWFRVSVGSRFVWISAANSERVRLLRVRYR